MKNNKHIITDKQSVPYRSHPYKRRCQHSHCYLSILTNSSFNHLLDKRGILMKFYKNIWGHLLCIWSMHHNSASFVTSCQQDYPSRSSESGLENHSWRTFRSLGQKCNICHEVLSPSKKNGLHGEFLWSQRFTSLILQELRTGNPQ